MALATQEAAQMVMRSHYRVCRDMCIPETPQQTQEHRRQRETSKDVRASAVCLSYLSLVFFLLRRLNELVNTPHRV